MTTLREDSGSPLSFFNSLIDIGTSGDVSAVAKEFLKQKNANAPYLRGSIANYTKRLTMTFPVLCDNSLTPETASMISRANERYIVSMLHMLFAAAQFNAQDGSEVIGSIHKNIRVRKSLDDYIDALDGFVGEAVDPATMADAVKQMESELKKPQDSFPVDSFSSRSLNDYLVANFNGKTKVMESAVLHEDPWWDFNLTVDPNTGTPLDPNTGKPLSRTGSKKVKRDPDSGYYYITPDPDKIQDYADNPKYVDSLNNMSSRIHQFKADKERNAAEIERQKMEREKFIAQQARDQRDQEQFDRDKKRWEMQDRLDYAKLSQYANQDLASQYDVIQKRLMDNDIKKSNELQPTLMIVNYHQVNSSNPDMWENKTFVAGVKSRLISVDSSDIVDRIAAKNRTRLSFLNFIRAMTGEIKFMKDFILCLDQAKIDAKNSVKKGEAARVWKTLESLSVRNNKNRLFKSGNDASAITTLVINQETVNLIKKQYEFDLERVGNAWKIMNEYNLLGIIIADESTEVVKTLYAGNDMWEQQAYSYLEKESNDKSYKKIINLIGQNRRF